MASATALHMTSVSRYLYNNRQSDARTRLRGLEDIEDAATIAQLTGLMNYDGRRCLEVGAGAGSIALWLARQVGPNGSVTATDLEPEHLDSSVYQVWRHDIEQDALPGNTFDLVHARHVLIHLANPLGALQSLYAGTKPGGTILVEESDLSSWAPIEGTTALLSNFRSGIQAVFELYESRGMNIAFGSMLPTCLSKSGFNTTHEAAYTRVVNGGSQEASYQSLSAKLLAGSLDKSCPQAHRISVLGQCLLDPGLRYQTRTTISVTGQK